MHKAKYLFVTLVPLGFMCAVTFSAGYLKVFSSDPRLGFLSGARSLLREASGMADPAKAAELTRQAGVWQFDAVVAVFFLVLVLAIVVGSARQWLQLIRGTKRVVLHENKFVPITAAQLAAILDRSVAHASRPPRRVRFSRRIDCRLDIGANFCFDGSVSADDQVTSLTGIGGQLPDETVRWPSLRLTGAWC